MARFVGISVDKVRRLTECSVLIAKLDRAEAAAPDAGLREALVGLVDAVTWALDGTDHLTDAADPIAKAYEKARAALAAHPAPAGPAVHMKQSGNGCVTCSRKWSEHTDAEKRELE